MLSKGDLDRLLKQLEQERISIEYSMLINDSAIDKLQERIALAIEQENNP